MEKLFDDKMTEQTPKLDVQTAEKILKHLRLCEIVGDVTTQSGRMKIRNEMRNYIMALSDFGIIYPTVGTYIAIVSSLAWAKDPTDNSPFLGKYTQQEA